QRPGIVSVTACDGKWWCCGAPANHSRQICVKQVIVAQQNPAAQVSRPRTRMSYRKRLLQLLLAAKIVDRNLARIENDDLGWTRIDHCYIKNRFLLRPGQDLPDGQLNKLV